MGVQSTSAPSSIGVVSSSALTLAGSPSVLHEKLPECICESGNTFFQCVSYVNISLELMSTFTTCFCHLCQCNSTSMGNYNPFHPSNQFYANCGTSL